MLVWKFQEARYSTVMVRKRVRAAGMVRRLEAEFRIYRNGQVASVH